MDELIKKLEEKHGLSAEQSQNILNTIVGYIKDKFPMVSGAVDNLFQQGTTPSSGTTPSDVQSVTDSTPPKPEDILGSL